MDQNQQMNAKKPNENIKINKSLILDPVNPTDYLQLNIVYACEHCSHFDSEGESCTIGYEAHLHRLEHQRRLYELTGRMAFCRFMEID